MKETYKEFFSLKDVLNLKPIWRGNQPIPSLGDVVRVKKVFKAVSVKKYYIQHGQLGFLASPFNPPQWLLDQYNGEIPQVHFFGVDLKEESKFWIRVDQELQKLEKLGINVPKKAYVLLKSEDEKEYENLSIAEAADLILELSKL